MRWVSIRFMVFFDSAETDFPNFFAFFENSRLLARRSRRKCQVNAQHIGLLTTCQQSKLNFVLSVIVGNIYKFVSIF